MAGSNKAKIAKRVIEVLEYFDDEHSEATVMDIVRRYGRPQSSTSELLSSLVELGLLYKDNYSRSYRLTPRAGLLGAQVQPDMVRSGRLTNAIDTLVRQTGLSVALFGMVNLNAQIFPWRNGRHLGPVSRTNRFQGGKLERLCDTAAGWMLLSTVEEKKRESMLRHLQAEASRPSEHTLPQVRHAIQLARRNGASYGPAGFDSQSKIHAVLLPDDMGDRPMALAFVHEPSAHVDEAAAIKTLKDAVATLIVPGPAERDSVRNLHAA